MKLLAFAIAFVSGTVAAFHIGDGVPLAALLLFAAAALLATCALLLVSLRRSPLAALAVLAFLRQFSAWRAW